MAADSVAVPVLVNAAGDHTLLRRTLECMPTQSSVGLTVWATFEVALAGTAVFLLSEECDEMPLCGDAGIVGSRSTPAVLAFTSDACATA